MKTISTRFLSRAFNTSAVAVGVLTFLGSFAAQSTAVAQTGTLVVTQMWTIAAGSRGYLPIAGNTERGIAYNPATDHVLLVSRAAGTNGVYILDSETGAHIGQMNITGIEAGPTFTMSTIGVTEDGIIYVASLTTSASVPFKVYRYENESAAPVIIHNVHPGGGARVGEMIDVRGTGTNTQIIAVGSSNTNAYLLTTTDGTNFTSTMLTANTGDFLAKGVSFGTNNTFYVKINANTAARQYRFDLATGAATFITNVIIDSNISGISVDTNFNVIAGVLTPNATTRHALKVSDLSNPANPQNLGDFSFPTPARANVNAVGAVDIGENKIFGLDLHNGIVAARIYLETNAIPPAFLSQPSSQTALEGGYVRFNVSASGTRPLAYLWIFNGTNILSVPDTNFLSLSNLTSAEAGIYQVIITNSAGSIASTNFILTVNTSVVSSVLTPLWKLGQGSRTYLRADDSHRGMAFNPANSNLLVISRSLGANIYVLDSATGADLHQMNVDTSVIFGGTFILDMIGVADDGVVFAANLVTTGNGASFALYRWENDSPTTIPTAIFLGDPGAGNGARWGDAFDVRGTGPNTQILLPSHTGGSFALFTTGDGINFAPTLINTDATADASRLGTAFGEGNVIWCKSSGGVLRRIEFDLAGATGTTTHTYTNVNTILPIGYDSANDYLAGVSSGDTPANLRFYDMANLAAGPVWIDTEFFATDNVNGNGVGSVDFGAGRIYALDANNGLIAATINPSAITITAHPASRTNSVGSTASFGVNSSGYPRSFQWYANGVEVPGATNGSLIIANVQAVTNGSAYFVVISNASGSVTSLVATLNIGPTITTQPPADTVLNAGEPLNLSATVDGAEPLAVQWYQNGIPINDATNQQYSVAAAQVSDAGNYIIVATNLFGSTTSSIARVTVVIPSTPGSGDGLTGNYYTNQLQTFVDPPTIVRVDPTIDFDFGTGGPDNVNFPDATNRFTVRWIGQVESLYPQTYTFYTSTDDGVRLWVDGQLIIDRWVNQAATEWSGTITLGTNRRYSIVMDYYENTGGASARLQWESPSQVKSVIPQSQLYSQSAPTVLFQPATTGTNSGSNVVLTVTAAGTPPLFFQWFFNNNAIGDATNNTYTITNLQSSSEGNYSVVVSNLAGSVTSSNAVLSLTTGQFELEIARLPNGEVRLTWDSVSGRSYQVQYRNNLVTGSWANTGGVVPATGTSTSTTLTPSAIGGTEQYYRVVFFP